MAEPIRFQDIYGAHAPAVYLCLLAWSRNAATAEDLTAETFVRALSAEQDVRANTARAYLVAIARNLWLEQVRRGWRQQPMEAALDPAIHTNPDAAVTLQSVLAALAELPESLREPLVLFAQGELPIATAKVRIFRARHAAPDIPTDPIMLCHAGETSPATRGLLLGIEAAVNPQLAAGRRARRPSRVQPVVPPPQFAGGRYRRATATPGLSVAPDGYAGRGVGGGRDVQKQLQKRL